LREVEVTQRNLEEMASKLRRDEAIVDLLVAHKRLCVSIGMHPLDCGNDLSTAGSGDGYEFKESPASASASTAAVSETDVIKKWRCNRCGYLADGAAPPEQCPVCGEKHDFAEVHVTAGEEVAADADWGSEADGSVPMGGLSRGAASPGFAGAASDRFLWKVQIGAFSGSKGVNERISQIRDLDLRLMDDRDAHVTPTRLGGTMYNRVRIVGLTESQAKALVTDMRRNNMEYWLLPPESQHWN